MNMTKQLSWLTTLILHQTVRKKRKEFAQKGYTAITEQNIWEYIREFLWKRQVPTKLSEKKEQILAITVNDFFDYQQLKVQTSVQQEFDWQHMQDLF